MTAYPVDGAGPAPALADRQHPAPAAAVVGPGATRGVVPLSSPTTSQAEPPVTRPTAGIGSGSSAESPIRTAITMAEPWADRQHVREAELGPVVGREVQQGGRRGVDHVVLRLDPHALRRSAAAAAPSRRPLRSRGAGGRLSYTQRAASHAPSIRTAALASPSRIASTGDSDDGDPGSAASSASSAALARSQRIAVYVQPSRSTRWVRRSWPTTARRSPRPHGPAVQLGGPLGPVRERHRLGRRRAWGRPAAAGAGAPRPAAGRAGVAVEQRLGQQQAGQPRADHCVVVPDRCAPSRPARHIRR